MPLVRLDVLSVLKTASGVSTFQMIFRPNNPAIMNNRAVTVA